MTLLLLACTGDAPPENQPPVVTSVSLSPAEVREGDTISSQVTWDDPEGDPVQLTYSWLVDGDVAQEGTGTVLTSDYFAAGQEVVLEVWGNDGTSDGDAAASAPLIIANTPPTVAGATILPEDPTVADTLTVEVEGLDDVDGDEVSATISWFVRNVEVATGEELTSEHFQRNDDVFVRVVPNDGTDDGEDIDSAKITIQNSPPEITSVSISPEEVGTDDTITASATGSDADGDSVIIRFDWYVDGDKVNGETSDELTGIHFDRDQVVYVIASGNDGLNQGEGLQSDDVLVVNAPPTAPGVEISPQTVGPDNDLSCAVIEDYESTDPDDDEITYSFEWTVNGTAYTGATETEWPGDSVSSDDTSVDDVWVCYGYASDGSLSSDPGTDEITVESVYSIEQSDLDGMSDTCSSVANKSMYNGCNGNDVGFTWTDGGSAAPVSVTIEVNHGISCTSGKDYELRLNGTALTDTWALAYSCACDPSEAEWSTTLTSDEISDLYVVGGDNSFEIEGDNCEGLTQNESWDDAYARVLVTY